MTISFLMLLTGYTAMAQDTTQRKTIEITSSFKPVLKKTAKIDLSPAPTGQDTVRPRLNYQVPVRDLSFSIAPASLRPAALQPDTTVPYTNGGYVKLGYGNFQTPYVDAQVSLGDGIHSSGALFGRYISSKSGRPFQQYSDWKVGGNGLFASGDNAKLSIGASLGQHTTYKYGYKPDTLKFTADQLLQRFTTFHADALLSNNVPTALGLSYAPSIGFWFFGDNNSGKETHFRFQAPIEKRLNDQLKFGIDLHADLVNFSGASVSAKSDLFTITPSVTWANGTLVLKAGAIPGWSNSQFKLLPDLELEAHVPDQPFMAIAGWKGFYEVNGYRSMANMNPWIRQPQNIFNTTNTEIYAGLKGSSGDHFSYMARVAAIQRKDVALFINDSTDGKTYRVINEPTINSVALQGEVSYQKGDVFFWSANLKAQTFGSFTTYSKAYGLIPMELNSHLRAKVMKDLYVTADLYYFEGNWYKTRTATGRTGTAIDLNAGAEFKVASKAMLWLQFNNVLNNTYQRWQQYQVLGFQVLGGVKWNF